MHISDIIAKMKAGDGHDATAIVETIKEGVAFTQKITPIASILGNEAKPHGISVLMAVLDAIHNIKEAAREAGVIFSEANHGDIEAAVISLKTDIENLKSYR